MRIHRRLPMITGSALLGAAVLAGLSTPAAAAPSPAAPSPAASSAAAPGPEASSPAAPTSATDAVVTSVAPRMGTARGGTTVTITGTGFTGAAGVTFDGTAGTGFSINAAGTTIKVVTPGHMPGPVPMQLVFPGGTAAAGLFTYTPVPPVTTSITPNSGPRSGGQKVTITGDNFVPVITTVFFNDVPATDIVVADDRTSLTAVTPAGTVGSAVVTVGTPSGSATLNYTYVTGTGAGPTITSLSPETGSTTGGTTVTIVGTGFTGATGVTFGGRPGTNLVVDPSGMSLTVTTPSGVVGTADVTVLTSGGNVTATGRFRYLVAVIQSIREVAPAEATADGGATITVTGSGFVPGRTTVTICGQTIPATEVEVAADGESFEFHAPSCSVAQTTITATTPDGTTNEVEFRYVGLPSTGSPVMQLITAGGGMLLTGATLLLLMWRRRIRLLRG